jgi:hypothetical protein
MWNWLCVHCSQVSGKFDSRQRSMYRFQVEQSTSLEIGVPNVAGTFQPRDHHFLFLHSFSKQKSDENICQCQEG